MRHLILVIILSFLLPFSSIAQSYTSYITGDAEDVVTTTRGGICLMGGASEDDEAMKWFLNQANGGDVLVMRASGSDGYNAYMTDLDEDIHSVETIVFHDATASNDPYIHERIQEAEAIWFAGGDQWDYISFWRDTPIDSLINQGIQNRNLVIGGTSAGMAIQGGFYFSAENGTVTSSTALSNPFDENITVDNTPFISNPYLENVITDTHYDSPDRKGRHVVFLSRMFMDYDVLAKGIACDEYTAICIDTNGIAAIYGGYPDYDDNAYFIQMNCELDTNVPEGYSSGEALDWNLESSALMVYAVKGTPDGNHTFDLNDWKTGTGGTWENWFVDNGTFGEVESSAPECNDNSSVDSQKKGIIQLYPNPTSHLLTVKLADATTRIKRIEVKNIVGQIDILWEEVNAEKSIIDLSHLTPSLYFITVTTTDNRQFLNKVKIQ